VKGANLAAYPDEALRLAVHRSVALETSRGWRITKEKASHRVDLVVALAQAAERGRGRPLPRAKRRSLARRIGLGTPPAAAATTVTHQEGPRELPKLDVAGSTPVYRSNFSTT